MGLFLWIHGHNDVWGSVGVIKANSAGSIYVKLSNLLSDTQNLMNT